MPAGRHRGKLEKKKAKRRKWLKLERPLLVDSDDEEEPEMEKKYKAERDQLQKDCEAEFDEYMKSEELKPEDSDRRGVGLLSLLI